MKNSIDRIVGSSLLVVAFALAAGGCSAASSEPTTLPRCDVTTNDDLAPASNDDWEAPVAAQPSSGDDRTKPRNDGETKAGTLPCAPSGPTPSFGKRSEIKDSHD